MAKHVYISYCRSGAEGLAHLLLRRLTDDGYEPWADLQGADSNQMHERMEECRDVLVLLSDNAFGFSRPGDDAFRLEIAYALETGKHIIPIMMRGFRWPDGVIPGLNELRFLPGIEVSAEHFDAAYPSICGLLSPKTSGRKKRGIFIALCAVSIAACIALGAGLAGMILRPNAPQQPPAATAAPTARQTTPTAVPTFSAAPAHTATPTRTPAPTPTATHAPRPAYHVGDRFQLGRYQQESVTWIILRINSTDALVVSEKVLDCMRFYPTHTSVTWKDSDVRTWMNQSFLYSCFTESERRAILPTAIVTRYGNTSYTTSDRIFSLDSSEARSYLRTLRAERTWYAQNLGAVENCWQLRDSDQGGKKVNFVLKGEIYNNVNTDAKGYGLRPAMWVDLYQLP